MTALRAWYDLPTNSTVIPGLVPGIQPSGSAGACGSMDPGTKQRDDSELALPHGEPRRTPSLMNTRNGVVPVALPSRERHLPLVQRMPPPVGTASNSTLLS